MDALEPAPHQVEQVRSIGRAVAVLQAINRGGSISMMAICREAAIPYPTACRIVGTLIALGLVEREPTRKRYRPTILVRTLSVGYREEEELVAVARPVIVELTTKLGWPVSICTRVGTMMMVRDSTHRLTTMTLSNYDPGYTLPLTECSTGKCWLAFAPPDERRRILIGMAALPGPSSAMAALMLHDESGLEAIRRRGHAIQARNAYTADPGKTSSIAAPVFAAGELRGALALIVFVSALSPRELEERYAEPVKAAAEEIGRRLATLAPPPAAG